MSDRTAANHQSAWSNLPPAYKIIISLVVVAAMSGVIFVINNPDFLHRLTGSGFKAGDCATVSTNVLSGGDMKHVDCSTAKNNTNFANPVYRVDQVKDGKDAVCPAGLSHLTFSNEPEDTTYCLTIVGMG